MSSQYHLKGGKAGSWQQCFYVEAGVFFAGAGGSEYTVVALEGKLALGSSASM